MVSRKTRQEIKRWYQFCGEQGIAPEKYEALEDFFCPEIEVQRSDPGILSAAFDKIREILEKVDEGRATTLRDLMTDAGLDPTVGSDRYAVRKFLQESGLVEHEDALPGRWVKRLTNGSTSH